MRVAAVDVGTNSVRLLVAEASGAGLRTIERRMAITRLGAGVDATGHLDDAALQRTLAVIDEYAAAWRRLDAEAVRIAATSAIRDAADRDRFFAAVRAATGVDAEVLTGDEEAAAAFMGATSNVAGTPPYLVIDIGGGSTELVRGRAAAEAATSRQLGCVRLTERCLLDDPPTPQQVAAAEALVADELDRAAAIVQPQLAQTLIGVAGTVTTVAALYLGLPAYLPERIHGTVVPAASLRTLANELVAMPSADRARLGPMVPGREDVIAAGALILAAACERYGFAAVIASEADILDGLALGLLERVRR